MKKKRLATALIIIMLVLGVALLLYPTVADYVNSMGYRRAIADFEAVMAEVDDSAYQQMLADARAYNERRAERGGSLLTLSEEQYAEYEQLLDVTGTGIMGYVEIPNLNIYLPIYHGTDEAVLQSGIGHLEGSSLPIGGPSTHSVISGHTGLPSAKLFTNIDQLVVGDTFTIRVLREVLTYEVDDITVILPTETNILRIEEGKDYCTLFTCTPYGVNTHRLLVRGHRIPTPPETQRPTQSILDVTDGRILGLNAEVFFLIAFCAILLLAVVIILLIRRKRRKNQYAGKHAKA